LNTFHYWSVAENPGVGSSSSIQVVQVGTSINIGHSHTRACTENQGALGDSEHYFANFPP
jgi:hypothetical protein